MALVSGPSWAGIATVVEVGSEVVVEVEVGVEVELEVEVGVEANTLSLTERAAVCGQGLFLSSEVIARVGVGILRPSQCSRELGVLVRAGATKKSAPFLEEVYILASVLLVGVDPCRVLARNLRVNVWETVIAALEGDREKRLWETVRNVSGSCCFFSCALTLTFFSFSHLASAVNLPLVLSILRLEKGVCVCVLTSFWIL